MSADKKNELLVKVKKKIEYDKNNNENLTQQWHINHVLISILKVAFTLYNLETNKFLT